MTDKSITWDNLEEHEGKLLEIYEGHKIESVAISENGVTVYYSWGATFYSVEGNKIVAKQMLEND